MLPNRFRNVTLKVGDTKSSTNVNKILTNQVQDEVDHFIWGYVSYYTLISS
jgi:hypothetical protein